MEARRRDERYAVPGFAYGAESNEFLRAVAHLIPPGPVLSLGEGEGRDAVYLAGLGHAVVAVDQSDLGLAKARQRAADMGVRVQTRQADLRDSRIEPGGGPGSSQSSATSRRRSAAMHAAADRGLRPGGVLVPEAYTPRQVGRGTGGPPSPNLMVTLADLTAESAGLEFLHAREVGRDVREGVYHTGRASVVQLVARPGAADPIGGR